MRPATCCLGTLLPALPSAGRGAQARPSLRRPAGARIRAVSFDNLVGAGEDRRRDRQAESPGGLEVHNQLELGRLLDRQVGRLGTAQDFIYENSSSLKVVRVDRSVGEEPASFCVGSQTAEHGEAITR